MNNSILINRIVKIIVAIILIQTFILNLQQAQNPFLYL